MGVDKARQALNEVVHRATNLLNGFGGNAQALQGAAHFMTNRMT
jgi:hypothetical protein